MRKKEKRGTLNGIRHVLAAVLFCMVMSIGFVCLADEQGTVSVASAKIRASADAKSEALASVKQGATVDIIGKTTGADGKEWYQVYVDANTKGFIRGDLVKVPDKSKIKTIQTSEAPAQNTDTTPTTATAVDAKRATVINNNVRIREGASTNHGIVGTANKGMVLTVTGETDASDGKWYQISFMYGNDEKTGFIRSDLVTFENVPPDAAESQITGEENPGEEQPQETAPAEEPPQETPPPEEPVNPFTPMQAEPLEYVLPGFQSVQPTDNGQTYQAYINGAEGKEQFYIIYGQKQDGETGWFLFDKERGVYIRYPYLVDGVKGADGITVGIVPVIVLVVIIVILAAAVGLLFLKLRENTVYGRSYGRDDDDDFGDDDITDLEELEEDEDDDLPMGRPQGRPVRRPQPQGQAPSGQPVRRPQPQGQAPSGQPQRRPQPQGQAPSGQPVRRPQPQGQAPSGQPVRRPQPQGGSAQSGTRPQGARPANGQQNPQRRPQPQGGNPSGRRPQPQNEKAPTQKGYKAKNLLEDDDMDFMDL